MTRLSPKLGGTPPSHPTWAARPGSAPRPADHLAARDGGCVVPDGTHPLAWCEGQQHISWLDADPTDLANLALALLCRAQHRAVHEAGWQLPRAPDGRFTATPPDRRPRRPPGRHRQPAGVYPPGR